MKKILNNFVLFLLIISVIFGLIMYRSYKNTKIKLDAKNTAYNDLFDIKDSIENLPPKITIIERWIPSEEKIVYQKVYEEPTEETKEYTGSIKNDSTDIEYNIQADNLSKVTFNIAPIYKYKTITVEKKVPYPFKVIEKAEVQKRGLYGSAGVGVYENFALNLGLSYITQNNYIYNVNYIRVKDIDIVTFGVGVRF